MTIQDPIITLGGEDTLTTDDNKDRGIEFRYYDSQERDLVSLVGMKITQMLTYGLALAGIASSTMPLTRAKFILALTLLSLLVTSD